MGFLSDFMPFYPRSRPKKNQKNQKKVRYDIERALDVQLHPHPGLTQHRAANGELVLCVKRQLHPAERFLARFVNVRKQRRLILDEFGEFMLNEALQPGTKLSSVAEAMARRFDLEPRDAKLGVIQLVQELMLREFVFLVREEQRPDKTVHEGS